MKKRYFINNLLDAVMNNQNWTEAQVAREIGCGKNMLTQWRKTGAPKYIKISLLAAQSNLHWVSDTE